MTVRLLNGYWTLNPGAEITITYWWSPDVDDGLQVAFPYPYYSGGVFATTQQGVNFEGAPYWKHFVTVKNIGSSAASFRLRSGNAT